ncbi:unnamed protein product [Orchesella dallaii]|uniref:glutathione transferase n=1 Tax=Orchesella dallaii TaxID=48710 RepID=A0ABP1S7X0_9HEXA
MDLDNYKLTYFDLRGIAEPIRLIFRYTNVPFEDHRVTPETWKDVKKTFKWQQLPFLDCNGKILTQSVAISRFLASKFGLNPPPKNGAWNQAKCDEIVGAINDLRLQIKSYVLSKMGIGSKEDGALLRNTLLTSSVPRFLENLVELLDSIRKDFGDDDAFSEGNFIFGRKPVWADFWLAHFTDQWVEVLEEPKMLEKYETLKKQQEEVYNLPGVAEWIKERPSSFI